MNKLIPLAAIALMGLVILTLGVGMLMAVFGDIWLLRYAIAGLITLIFGWGMALIVVIGIEIARS